MSQNSRFKEIMPASLQNVDILVVSSDYSILKMFTGAVQQLGGQLNSTPSLTTAGHFVQGRRLDGIVIDMEMSGAQNFLENIRNGGPNRSSVIFGCAGPEQPLSASHGGVNFVFHKPLTPDKIVDLLESTSSLLQTEQKRYFRHKLVIPVNIYYGGVHHRALTSNMSETGMAIRTFRVFAPGSAVEFSFDLPAGPGIKGKGEIMWVDAEGHVGIKFNLVTCAGRPPLSQWLDTHSIVHN